LSRVQVTRALAQMVSVGLVEHDGEHYRRVSIERIRGRFKLDSSYAPVRLPREALGGRPARFSKAILLAVQHYLPNDLSTWAIGNASGRSRATVYRHEEYLETKRTPRVKRAGQATASSKGFIKVFDREGKYVLTEDATDDRLFKAQRLAAELSGSAWQWEQAPSLRRPATFKQLSFEETGS